MNAAIAQHLNVAETAIIRVEEWANVVFTVVRGLGARFVSKKVIKMNRQQVVSLLLKAPGHKGFRPKLWEKEIKEKTFRRVYVSTAYFEIEGTEEAPTVKIIAGRNFAQQIDLIRYCESVGIDCGKRVL